MTDSTKTAMDIEYLTQCHEIINHEILSLLISISTAENVIKNVIKSEKTRQIFNSAEAFMWLYKNKTMDIALKRQTTTISH